MHTRAHTYAHVHTLGALCLSDLHYVLTPSSLADTPTP